MFGTVQTPAALEKAAGVFLSLLPVDDGEAGAKPERSVRRRPSVRPAGSDRIWEAAAGTNLAEIAVVVRAGPDGNPSGHGTGVPSQPASVNVMSLQFDRDLLDWAGEPERPRGRGART